MALEIKLRRRTPDDSKDAFGAHAVIGCMECQAVMGAHWPLWGIHLTAVLTYHAAHWLIAEARNVPVLQPEDVMFGRRLGIVDAELPA